MATPPGGQRRGMRRRSSLVGAVVGLGAAATLAGCSGDAGTAFDSEFCQEVREREDEFVASGENEVPPTLVGALRSLVQDGDPPDEVRDAFNELTEATSDEDLDDAVAQLEESLADCGVDMDG